MKILLIEDDPSLDETIEKRLRLDGHAVDWFMDGQQIANLTPFNRYDCLVLDRGIPNTSGDKLLKIARKENQYLTPKNSQITSY